MLGSINEEAWASAVVNANGTTQNTRGCSVARVSAGTYEVTLSRGIDVSECNAQAMIIDNGPIDALVSTIEHNSDELKTIRFYKDSASPAQDASFHLRIAKFVG